MENGEQGAAAMCTIEPKEASWCLSMASSVPMRAPSVVSTAKSGGRPPSFSLRSIEPRARVIRAPMSATAASSAPTRSPEPWGKT